MKKYHCDRCGEQADVEPATSKTDGWTTLVPNTLGAPNTGMVSIDLCRQCWQHIQRELIPPPTCAPFV